ncbi:MAG: ribose-phosphate pyrophosphokinase-like domain-containing protein, partial [Bacilli bacterium]
MSLNNTVIFSLSSSIKLADDVCKELGVIKGECTVNTFADGEILVEIGHSVRGKNCYVIQSTCAPTSQTLMELLIMMDALKRASARTINVITPYF